MRWSRRSSREPSQRGRLARVVSFGQRLIRSEPFDRGNDVTLGDVDGDGDMAAVVTQRLGTNTSWLKGGAVVFSESPNPTGTGDSTAEALGDPDGDGDLDAVVLRREVRVWRNNNGGQFTFGPALNYPGNNNLFALVWDVALADFDHDRDLDIAVGGFGGSETSPSILPDAFVAGPVGGAPGGSAAPPRGAGLLRFGVEAAKVRSAPGRSGRERVVREIPGRLEYSMPPIG